jgi:DNA polymerase III epsilon subunit-like protein
MRTTMRRPEMVFFDVETTAASADEGQRSVLEFGAIVVCPRRLVEVDSYHTVIRPGDMSAVSKRFAAMVDVDVASAPSFDQVAERIFGVLDGRVWAGHNIQRFDCHRIREAFAAIGRAAPEPVPSSTPSTCWPTTLGAAPATSRWPPSPPTSASASRATGALTTPA